MGFLRVKVIFLTICAGSLAIYDLNHPIGCCFEIIVSISGA